MPGKYWRIFGALLLYALLTRAVTAVPVQLGVPLSWQGNPPLAHLTAELDQAKACGARLVRIHADWPRIQPAANAWQFDWLDVLVNGALNRGLQVVLVFGTAPKWAVSYLDPNPSAEEVRRALPDLPAYRTYVTMVARRYHDRVRYYQLWERPGCTTLLAMPAEIYALYRTGAKAVHTVNPSLQVIAPEPADIDEGWMANYLQGAVGINRADILQLSPVRLAATPRALWWKVQVLRNEVLPAKVPVLWGEIPFGPGNAAAQTRLAGAMLMQRIGTVFLAPDCGFDSAPANHGAMAGIASLAPLQGSEYAGWSANDGNTPVGVFHLGGRMLALSVPSNDNPVAIVAAPRTFVPETPKALPVPVTRNEVSLDLSGNDPAAIHPLRGLPGGAYQLVMENGHQAISTVQNAAPWVYFDVPDGFLFYNARRIPVEVAIRVCGVRSSKRNGFNLYYDGVHGMTNSAWQWIDAGPDQLYTYTFRLNDARFADSGGYDFRLNMGGSDENVIIDNITIRKLPPGR